VVDKEFQSANFILVLWPDPYWRRSGVLKNISWHMGQEKEGPPIRWQDVHDVGNPRHGDSGMCCRMVIGVPALCSLDAAGI